MTYEKSLKILGLDQNFTKAQLNKKYKDLMKKYHPDLYEYKSEEEKRYAEQMTKDINAAKDFLEKYSNQTRSNSSYNSQNYSDFTNKLILNTTKKQYKSVFLKMLDFNSERDCPDLNNVYSRLTIKTYVALKNIIKSAIDKMNMALTLEKLEDIYQKENLRIKIFLIDYAEKYLKLYNGTIKVDFVKDLDYTSFKKLYNGLCDIVKKQNKIRLANMLEEECMKYNCYAGYEDVSKSIYELKEQTVNRYKNTDNLYEIVRKFNEQVLKIFETYFLRKDQLKDLIQQTKDIDDEKLQALIDGLKLLLGDQVQFDRKYRFINSYLNSKESSVSTEETRQTEPVEDRIERLNRMKKLVDNVLRKEPIFYNTFNESGYSKVFDEIFEYYDLNEENKKIRKK